MELTQEYLYQRYVIEGATVSQISLETRFTKDQIKGKLRRYGIRKKPMKLTDQPYDNKEWLHQQYIVLGKGYTVIANDLGVSYITVLSRILHFGWPVRGHREIDKGEPRRGKKHSEESLLKIRQSRQKKRVLTNCSYCHLGIELVLSSFKKSRNNFCNQSCFKKYLEKNRVEPDNITDSAEYKNWRIRVYKRDGYRCKMPGCYSQSRDIAAHHIYPKKKYPQIQFDTSNGITLCRPCHEKTYGREEQFIAMLVRVVQTMDD